MTDTRSALTQDVIVRASLDGLADLLEHRPEPDRPLAPLGLHALLAASVGLIHSAATGHRPSPTTCDWLAREAALRLLAAADRPLLGTTDPRLPTQLADLEHTPASTLTVLLRAAAHADSHPAAPARPEPAAPSAGRRRTGPCPCACTRPCGCGHAGCTAR